jgi:hypothetical protein
MAYFDVSYIAGLVHSPPTSKTHVPKDVGLHLTAPAAKNEVTVRQREAV